MFYMVYLQDTELEVPVVTVCKNKADIAKLLINSDNKYVVSAVELVSADFLDNHKDMCSKSNDLETGKEIENVNK